MNEIELKSLAKINLGLDVLGRRENGYHDVRMVMQSIYLHDEVKIEKKRREGIEIVSNLRFLPIGEGNIQSGAHADRRIFIGRRSQDHFEQAYPGCGRTCGRKLECGGGFVRYEPVVPARFI